MSGASWSAEQRQAQAARVKALHDSGAIKRRPPNRHIWTAHGQLRNAIVRQIAHRLKAGDGPDTIISDLGISRTAGRRQCRQIAKAIGLPSREEQHALVVAEVRRRFEAGESRQDIATAVGKSLDMVKYILRRIGLADRSVGLTPTQVAQIDERLAAGMSLRKIAVEVGCSTTPVIQRREIAPPSDPEQGTCECGRPMRHGGRCRLKPEMLAHIRSRLIEGAFSEQIARELGMVGETLRTYTRPILAELRAQGVRCRCGSDLGHLGSCTASMAGRRHTFSDQDMLTARQMLISGETIEALAGATNLAQYPARLLRKQALSQLMREGAVCACGASIEHTGRCSARRERKPRARRARHNSQARMVSPSARVAIDGMARRGEPLAIIQTTTGEPLHRVRAFVDGLEAAGLLPEQCARCTRPYRHRGSCGEAANCGCGRPRNHQGICRKAKAPATKATVFRHRLRDDRERMIYDLYRRGVSARKISEQLGLARTSTSALIASWQAKSQSAALCDCGRPARHPGGCTKNTPGALGNTWLQHIEDMTRAGAKQQDIADRLGLSQTTVSKHSAAIRAQLASEGVRCGCGRPLSHRGACSKDAAAKLRQIELPAALQRQVRNALLTGVSDKDAATLAGITTAAARAIRRQFTPAESVQRAAAIRKHRASTVGSDVGNILARVQAAVSRNLDGALRDDVINDLCLAVLDGRVAESEIKAAARTFTSCALKAWQSQYGPRSLDEERGDGGLKLLDTLGDDTSPNFIDDIELGDLT